MRRRSVGVPIVLASVATALSIALLVGWIIAILRTGRTWLMVGGIISFAIIMVAIVLSAYFLVREILEVRRQTTFIDAVTHELKSPLASMRLCVETLARPELDEGRRAELRRMMLDDVERLGGVVDGILAASRLTAGRVASEVREVPIAALLEDAIARVVERRHVEPERVRLEAEGAGALVGDPRALSSIIENLVDNAIKYADPKRGPEVIVRARSLPRERVAIEVEDKGIGIPKRDLRRVFNRFYRAPEETVRAQHGTGLGLFVVRSLVRNMGGRVDAKSEGLGKGSKIELQLPRR